MSCLVIEHSTKGDRTPLSLAPRPPVAQIISIRAVAYDPESALSGQLSQLVIQLGLAKVTAISGIAGVVGIVEFVSEQDGVANKKLPDHLFSQFSLECRI